MDGWIDEWMDEEAGERVNEQINEHGWIWINQMNENILLLLVTD